MSTTYRNNITCSTNSKRPSKDDSILPVPTRMKRQLLETARTELRQAEPENLFEYEKLTIRTNQPLQEIFNLLRDNQIMRAKIKFRDNVEISYTGDEQLAEWERLETQRAIRKDYQEHKKYIDTTEKKYGKRFLWYKDPYLPRSWMDENAGNKTPKQKETARALIKRLDKDTRFIDIYNYLDSKVAPSGKEQTNWEHKMRLVDGKPKYLGLLHIDQTFYSEAVKDLSVGQKDTSVKTIQRHIHAFCDLGILVLLKKGGQGRASLYAIGVWEEWRNSQYRLIRFLTRDRPGIDALLKFRTV